MHLFFAFVFKGTDKVEGMFLDLSKITSIHLSPQAFANMPNLRFLKFYMPEHNGVPIMISKVHLDQGLEYLPNELRYLHWHEYPLKALPFDFEPENLVKLNLPYSKVVQIWEGKKRAFKLKYVDIHNSQYLIRMPDLSETPNLERTNLKNCINLTCVPSSVQNFNHLSMLCFEGCKSLRSFPSNLHFMSPIKIDFSSCFNLTEFPQISGNITDLILSETAIQEVPSSIECLTNLEKLYINRCMRLKRLSTSICKLKSLHVLVLDDCSKLERFPEILEKMESVKCISLERTAITELPSSFANLEGLKDLYIGGSSLRQLNLSRNDSESLPASITQLSQLRSLHLKDCSMLSSLPELPQSLELLDAENCKQLQFIPEILSGLEEVDASVLEKATFLNSAFTLNSACVKFVFSNCLKLNEKANNEILADSQRWIQHMAIATFRLFDENKYSHIKGPSIILPGSEIPEWFSNQSSGSSITVQPPQNCCRNLIGFALCAVLDYNERIPSGFSSVFCEYRFEVNALSGIEHVYENCLILASTHELIDSDHVVLGFNPCWNVGDGDDHRIFLKFFDIHKHHTAISFEFICDSYKVKSCGVCPVYANPSETKPNTFTLKFATRIGKLDDKAASPSGTSDEEELEPRICSMLHFPRYVQCPN
ncbi:hypothetical protein CUMW_238710 [Citrus unshiu]|uniref:Uncharacterized protein n=1 Tax=Citrus unshiu TaxID=55188 RepID=A0A2H5QKF6_CITUN|nr:hypothetical protein CUMW_238710 [Citrus unshiu]